MFGNRLLNLICILAVLELRLFGTFLQAAINKVVAFNPSTMVVGRQRKHDLSEHSCSLEKVSRSKVFLFVRKVSDHGEEDGDGDDDGDSVDDDESDPFDFFRSKKKASEDRLRKRDVLRDWLTSSSSTSKSMVRPIRMEDGSIIEPPPNEPNRVQAKFDSLFKGMPSINDILGDGNLEVANVDLGATAEDNVDMRKSQDDESWFDAERREIVAKYEEIWQEISTQLRMERTDDPEGVPHNAEGVMKTVLLQEMEAEISQTREERARERLETYEDELVANLGSRVPDKAGDATIQRLMDESEEEYEKQEKSRIELDEFIRYEQQAFQRALAEESDISLPEKDQDLDLWALDRMKEMASVRQGNAGEDKSVLYILEDNIDELESKITKQSERRSSVDLKSSREWQMYRSIATRLENDSDSSDISDDEEKEARIAAQLQSWKEYQVKEDENRKQAGLARGPRLPFEWQEVKSESIEVDEESASLGDVDRSRAEVRREINRQAVEALEDLVQKGGSSRSESLKKELASLKAQLASQDFLDVDESELWEEAKVIGPVDISDVFSSRSFDDDDTLPIRKSQTSLNEESVDFLSPDTPFFQAEEDNLFKPPPPQTPFYSEDAALSDLSSSDVSKLGSLDEQKLRSMYRRADARTLEEQEGIRQKWEEYQEIEKIKRAQYGLSMDEGSDIFSIADVKVNISSVLKDGDIDAEQVLAAIGPRPKRSKPATSNSDGIEFSHAINKAPNSTRQKESVRQKESDRDEISSALYRAVAATGGGRTRDNPVEKEKEKRAYEEFLQKENELRQRLDEVDQDIPGKVMGENIDDVDYAKKVLESLGPRPVPKRTRVDLKEYNENGREFDDVDEDDDSDDEDDDEEALQVAGTVETLPNWVKKEREEVRRKGGIEDGRISRLDIDEAFDDDDYEKNMRQLAEYEYRRTAGRKSSGGVDISGLFLSRDESDDYRDYGFDDYNSKGKSKGQSFSRFDIRKANLLEYSELTVQELNSLMDNRDSVYATGVSQYLPRINKPFKEFGAIFRLEGVLIDITGFQFDAYKRVAEKHGFRQPEIEDVRRASVTRSDFAIREIFYWTDDILLCREAAATHRRVLRDVIAEWMGKTGLTSASNVEASESVSSNDIDAPAVNRQSGGRSLHVASASEEVLADLLSKAWSHTAMQFGLRPPSLDEIYSSAGVGPDVAVRAFGWSKDTFEIEKISKSYRRNINALTQGQALDDEIEGNMEGVSEGAKSRRYVSSDRNLMMEMAYKAWSKTALDNGFEPPSPEEVLAAIVINDPVVVARDGFGWTEDQALLADLVNAYNENLSELMNVQTSGSVSVLPVVSVEKPHLPQGGKPSRKSETRPSKDEILDMYVYAWNFTAEKHGFEMPPLEQIQLASKTDSNEAIRRLFGWTRDDEQVTRVSATFNAAMKKISEKYIQTYNLVADAPPAAPVRPAAQKKTPSGDEIFQAAFDAWSSVARKFGFQRPDNEQVQFAMTVGPDEAIMSGFEWTSDPAEAAMIIQLYKDNIETYRSQWQATSSSSASHFQVNEKENEIPPCVVVPGAANWVKSLLDNEMQCGIMSYLDRDQVDVLLNYSGLSSLFGPDKRVTSSSGYDRERQQMLGVALRIERRPDHCVVFDASPFAAVEARDVEMKNVAIIGNYPRYELLESDLTASSFDELTSFNLRRLFGERVDDQPMFDMQQTQPESRRKIRTRFWEEGDRI